ncbi:hypothetical protein RJ640_028575 [Escallonia rubra]|uniref:CCHC-type domain-containing protein n=1 Tax=Escallonia rubra TaxID=112253 RepID=A0AA88QR16_9ASTE|nr:hypothetical protein RJ640_028575 [Escallonia rubra]
MGNMPESMDQDNWEELQAKAVSTIQLNLAPKVKYQVLTETSPTALWQKLEKIYMSNSLSNRLYLKKDLYQLQMDKGSDLGDHISEFNRLVSQLSSIDVKLEEEDQTIWLLSLLPKSYETLKTMLLIGNETLLIDDVMSALMDSSRVNRTSSNSQSEGLVVRSENKNGHGRGRGRSRSRNPGHGKDRSKSRGSKDKSSIECWYCKEIGHIARKCPERKEKKNGKKHVNNANVAEEDDKSSDGDLYLVSSVEQKEREASVSTHAGSSNDNSELWHKRLGHLSEGERIWACELFPRSKMEAGARESNMEAEVSAEKGLRKKVRYRKKGIEETKFARRSK